MFAPEVYRRRREELFRRFEGESGVIVLNGGKLVPGNSDEKLPFRQNSNVLYLTGIDMPDITILLDPKTRKYYLFADPSTVDDAVWKGENVTLDGLAQRYIADEVHPHNDLRRVLEKYDFMNKKPHSLVGLSPVGIEGGYQTERLRDALIEMRLRKGPEEIEAIEKALDTTAQTYKVVMRMTKGGLEIDDIKAVLAFFYAQSGYGYAFPPSVTQRGNILHAKNEKGPIEDGKLILVDSGARHDGYAADITRTWPVNGRFTNVQRQLYGLVLEVQKEAIESIRPGAPYTDIHIQAERKIAEGLLKIGLLKGNLEAIIKNGAHRLFFPHGLGHAIGLDDHDIGEFPYETAGYSAENPKSNLFGRRSLRFARVLEPGHVITVEPGVYFIEALLAKPEHYEEHEKFIDLDLARRFITEVSGIRIEDVVLVTDNGHRVLGPNIPKEVNELEEIVGKLDDESRAFEQLVRLH